MIIAIHGRAGAGKDTFADAIPGAIKLPLAAPLKKMVNKLYGWSAERDKELPDPNLGGLTPRRAYQIFGTEAARQCYERTWLVKWEREWLKHPNSGSRLFVVPDVRFPNEISFFENLGATLVWIRRPDNTLQVPGHSSENLDAAAFQWDHIIVNDGTVRDLQNLARMMTYDSARS